MPEQEPSDIDYVPNSSSESQTDSSSDVSNDTSDIYSESIKENIKKFLPIIYIDDTTTKKRKHSDIDDSTYNLIKEIKSVTMDDKSNLLKRIVHSKFDNRIKNILLDMYEDTSMDKIKFHNYIERVLKIPNGVYKNINSNNDIPLFMSNLRKNLDDAIAGHSETKEEIIDYISSILRNPSANSNILALHGPRGTGKTKFIRALGKALNLPFHQISFGGMTDPSILTGHDFTYVGSKPGKIYDIITKAKCMNSIIMLDEIDKIGDMESSSKTQEINGILTHILDKEQNNDFHDNYLGLEFPLDLSKILFIATFNHEHKIDPIVLNRMKVIKIKESTLSEKIQIVKKFTIPEIISNYKLEKFNIEIDDKLIKYIIMNKTIHEPGMRNINKNIRTIFGKINTLLFLEKASEIQREAITKDLSYSKVKLNKNDEKIIIDLNTIDSFIPVRSSSQFISMMYN